jgi:hypothetical protein
MNGVFLVRLLRGFLRDPNPLKYILDTVRVKKLYSVRIKKIPTLYTVWKSQNKETTRTVKCALFRITVRGKG